MTPDGRGTHIGVRPDEYVIADSQGVVREALLPRGRRGAETARWVERHVVRDEDVPTQVDGDGFGGRGGFAARVWFSGGRGTGRNEVAVYEDVVLDYAFPSEDYVFGA
jgi:hypothetical protein